MQRPKLDRRKFPVLHLRLLGKFFSHVHLFDNNTGVNCANGRGLGIAKALNCGGDEGDRVG